MSVRKTAISIPAELLDQVDRAARDRGESRSAYIARVLRLAVQARRDAEVTRKLDVLFADPGMASDQLEGAQDLDAVGTDWTDERW